MKTTFKKIVKSLTGFSIPVFGVQWTPPETDLETVRKLMAFFEDRRILYNPYTREFPPWVTQSVLEIRRELTYALKKMGDTPEIVLHLRAMRAACRKFMDSTARPIKFGRPFINDIDFIALGEMRAIFGIHIAQLCVKYRICIEGDLATILPIEDK